MCMINAHCILYVLTNGIHERFEIFHESQNKQII